MLQIVHSCFACLGLSYKMATRRDKLSFTENVKLLMGLLTPAVILSAVAMQFNIFKTKLARLSRTERKFTSGEPMQTSGGKHSASEKCKVIWPKAKTKGTRNGA